MHTTPIYVVIVVLGQSVHSPEHKGLYLYKIERWVD